MTEDIEKLIRDGRYCSENTEIDNVKYCIYCGQETRQLVVHGSYQTSIEDDVYDYCDCKDAKEEARLWKKFNDAEDALIELAKNGRMKTDPMFRKIEYQKALEKLQEEYKDVVK
jgi:hypothetical protein